MSVIFAMYDLCPQIQMLIVAKYSMLTDWNSNGIYAKIQLYNAHGDVIFIQIREKYKKLENIFDWNSNIVFY